MREMSRDPATSLLEILTLAAGQAVVCAWHKHRRPLWGLEGEDVGARETGERAIPPDIRDGECDESGGLGVSAEGSTLMRAIDGNVNDAHDQTTREGRREREGQRGAEKQGVDRHTHTQTKRTRNTTR